MKKEKVYCIYCGKENKKENKKCDFCKKNLKEKDHELRDYMMDKVKQDMEGKSFNFLKAWIKKYFYGVMVSLSVLSSAAMIVVSHAKEEEKRIVEEKPVWEGKSRAGWIDGCWEAEPGSKLRLIAYEEGMDVETNKNWFVISEDEKHADFYYDYYNIGSGMGTSFKKESNDRWTFEDGAPIRYITNYKRVSCDNIEEDTITYVAIYEEEKPSNLSLEGW